MNKEGIPPSGDNYARPMLLDRNRASPQKETPKQEYVHDCTKGILEDEEEWKDTQYKEEDFDE